MKKEFKILINGENEFKAESFDKSTFTDMRGMNYDEKVVIFSLNMGAYLCKETLILEEFFLENKKIESLKISLYEDDKIVYENSFEKVRITGISMSSFTSSEEKSFHNISLESMKQEFKLFDEEGNLLKQI